MLNIEYYYAERGFTLRSKNYPIGYLRYSTLLITIVSCN